MRTLCIIIIIISLPSIAKDNVQLLKDATQAQEKALLNKYKIMPSQRLEKKCMQLAKELEFNKIKQCQIINSPNINAYVLANGHVYFSLAMMQYLNNKHQWASILAHENAHLELNHYHKTLEKYQNPGLFFPKSKIKKMLRKHETEADEWSNKNLKKQGYDTDQIYFFMQRVIDVKGNKKTNSHLQPSKRSKKSNSVELLDKSLIQSINELD